MKAAAFDYERPDSLAAAAALLARDDIEVRPLAGGQSLGPMLNLRLVQPELLVDIRRIPELTEIQETDDWLTLGACTTHAAIEDGRVPDATGGVLPAVASGIAYRAVRNRGTIGGSLAHADPAADWVSALAALGAEAVVFDGSDQRMVPADEFVIGPFQTVLHEGEMLQAIRIPRLSGDARWGYFKVCRRAGEFADAIGAVLHDPDRSVLRAVIGATDSPPITLADASELFGGGVNGSLAARFDQTVARRILEANGMGGDPYVLQVHLVALKRAIEQASR
jgi:carbon-monoxide dehydrogenase medium subunit